MPGGGVGTGEGGRGLKGSTRGKGRLRVGLDGLLGRTGAGLGTARFGDPPLKGLATISIPRLRRFLRLGYSDLIDHFHF